METITGTDVQEKLSASEYVILDFSSPGCAPCKKVPALLEEVTREVAGQDLRIYEVDITREAAIARTYFVLGVPTIVIFRHGKEIARFNSLPRKEKIVLALS
jgi:thioredoxin 1